MRDPERVMSYVAKRTFFSTFRRQGKKAQKQINILNDTLGSDDEGPSSFPEHGTTPAPEFFLQFLNRPHLFAQIRETAQEEVKRIYARNT